MREQTMTGDLLLLEGRGLFSVLIRVLTGQQISHVAMLVWIEHGLWVAEMRNAGYTLTPASQRIPEMHDSGQVYWGPAPRKVRLQYENVTTKVLSFRGSRYSWWSLLTVWASQVTKRRLPGRLVCSTLVERAWRAGGFEFTRTPDPGDFMHLCQRVHPIEYADKG